MLCLGISLLVISLTGCSKMQPIDISVPQQDVISGIRVGDQIEIKTSSGDIRSILVSSISDRYIESADEKFSLSEIEIIAQRKINTAEKGMAVGAGLVVGVLMQTLLMALILGLAF